MVLTRREIISEATLKKAEDEKKDDEDKVWNLEAALGIFKDKLKKIGEEMSVKLEELREDKKKLEEDLRVEWAPVDDEAEDLNVMNSRGEMVEKIECLKLYFFEMGQACFNLAVTLLKGLNPGLIFEGIGLSAQVIGKRLVSASLDEKE